jgi:hypothetical protein
LTSPSLTKIDSQLIPRPRSDQKHPVLDGNYILPTKAIDRMCTEVTTWVENRSPGGLIKGKPRLGKTRGAWFLKNYFWQSNNGGYPTFLINCRAYKFPSEPMFMEDMLSDVGHACVRNGKPNEKRDRLIQFLIDHARRSNQNRIILIFDDAQRLHSIQYEWLMDIYNALDRCGIYMTALLFGQKDLGFKYTSLKAAETAQIIGRFMVQSHTFTGVVSLEELHTCLEGYDENSEFPEDSGWSFTRYFFPEMYEHGFRLKNYAENIFALFKMAKNGDTTSKIEIPMQYLSLAVEYCLKRFGVDGDNLTHLEKKQWAEAIKNSGYSRSI